MSMGVFMPPHAPLMTGGGGTVLDGMITIGNFLNVAFGWSDGSAAPAFGGISGDASAYFHIGFMWDGTTSGRAATVSDISGAVLTFQGYTYTEVTYDPDYMTYQFIFGPEVATWPTSGTHPFTLTLP